MPGTAKSRPGFWRSVWEDLAARRDRRPGPLFFLGCLLGHRGFLVLFLYRLGCALPGRFPAWCCRRLGVLLTGVSLHETATIGVGLVIPHPHAIVIGRDVVIGGGTYLYQGVVVGPKGNGDPRAARIGENVRIYPHACVLGDVTVGDETEIGANSVVLASVPSRSVVMPPTSQVLRGLPFAMQGFRSPARQTDSHQN